MNEISMAVMNGKRIYSIYNDVRASAKALLFLIWNRKPTIFAYFADRPILLWYSID